MKDKIVKAIKTNYLILAYIAASIIMELTAVTVTGGAFFIRKPWIYLSLLLVFTAVMYSIRNNTGRFWYAFALLLFNFVVDIVFIVVYDMTDTIFDFSMLNLRNDAMAIIESIPINFWYVLIAGTLISAYLVVGKYFIKRVPKPQKYTKIPAIITSVVMACTLVVHGTFAYFSHRSYDPGDLQSKLTRNDTSSYADKGVMGNFFDELYKGAFFSKVKLGSSQELESFIYAEHTDTDLTPLSGVAKDYNVVMVLCESFEWFSFMNSFPGEQPFVNGFNSDYETLKALYPNLTELYENSVVCTNYHSREKTDIAENISIIGAYPTDCYINYDYPDNTVVTSLARTLKKIDPNSTSNYFHNGTASFYNRNTFLKNALGFDSFTAAGTMVKRGMTDYLSRGERNLDSEMIDVCYEDMFPTDKRFFSYITTITQHGQYEPRSNLKKYYDKLDAAGVALMPEKGDKNYNAKRNFRTYVAAAMELDAAVGQINKYLTERNLMDNTVLVLFGDHNAYYSSLSGDIKGIDETGRNEESVNYTDLFRVPLMIRIGNGEHAQTIDKFTCTADIVPTVYDLLGINVFSNLLFGQSVFTQTESVLYSRAYDIFMTDKMYFTSLYKAKYKSASATQDYIYGENGIRQRASELLDKLSHTNRIFYYDYLSGAKAEEYYDKLLSIQPQN